MSNCENKSNTENINKLHAVKTDLLLAPATDTKLSDQVPCKF